MERILWERRTCCEHFRIQKAWHDANRVRTRADRSWAEIQITEVLAPQRSVAVTGTIGQCFQSNAKCWWPLRFIQCNYYPNYVSGRLQWKSSGRLTTLFWLFITYKVSHFTMKWVKTSPKHHHFDLKNVSNWFQPKRVLKYRPIAAKPEKQLYIRIYEWMDI